MGSQFGLRWDYCHRQRRSIVAPLRRPEDALNMADAPAATVELILVFRVAPITWTLRGPKWPLLAAGGDKEDLVYHHSTGDGDDFCCGASVRAVR